MPLHHLLKGESFEFNFKHNIIKKYHEYVYPVIYTP